MTQPGNDAVPQSSAPDPFSVVAPRLNPAQEHEAEAYADVAAERAQRLLKRLTVKSWRHFTQIDVSLDSRVTVLIGPNGTGKSTLLALLHALFWPSVELNLEPNDEKLSRRRNFASVTLSNGQSVGLWPQMQRLARTLKISGQPRTRLRGVAFKPDKTPFEYAGGPLSLKDYGRFVARVLLLVVWIGLALVPGVSFYNYNYQQTIRPDIFYQLYIQNAGLMDLSYIAEQDGEIELVTAEEFETEYGDLYINSAASSGILSLNTAALDQAVEADARHGRLSLSGELTRKTANITIYDFKAKTSRHYIRSANKLLFPAFTPGKPAEALLAQLGGQTYVVDNAAPPSSPAAPSLSLLPAENDRSAATPPGTPDSAAEGRPNEPRVPARPPAKPGNASFLTIPGYADVQRKNFSQLDADLDRFIDGSDSAQSSFLLTATAILLGIATLLLLLWADMAVSRRLRGETAIRSASNKRRFSIAAKLVAATRLLRTYQKNGMDVRKINQQLDSDGPYKNQVREMVAVARYAELLPQYLPEELQIERVEVADDVYAVTKSGETYRFSSLSHGTTVVAQLLWEITKLATDEKPFLVVMDEPENHLHPGLQRSLLASLVRDFDQAQFVIASHSPFFIGAVPDAQVCLLEFDGDAVTSEMRRFDAAGTVDEILSEALGMPETRPEWIEKELKQLVASYADQPMTVSLMKDVERELKSIGRAKLLPEVVLYHSLERARRND